MIRHHDPRLSPRRYVALVPVAMLGVLLTLAPVRDALAQQFVPCAPFGTQPIVKVPEITRDAATRTLKGVVVTADEQRTLWFRNNNQTFCAPQYMRFFKGYRLGQPDDWNVSQYAVSGFAEPLPGPTLRARVGDLVQLMFLNQIDVKDFGNSIDRAEMGQGCDVSTTGAKQIYPGSDTMPNCIHGSSTTNLHFHGTHTTPATTGDNVLLQVRPSLRTYPPEPNGRLVVTESVVRRPFEEFFAWCARNGPPTRWDQLPRTFREQQMGRSATRPGGWLGDYDRTAAYRPAPLWPSNQEAIRQGQFPQYFIGAFPYCFRLPDIDTGNVRMGQSPGTHWYHAHKHGSTDINVSNGLAGALIVEGKYDDGLREFYRTTATNQNWDLEEVVMMVQQLGTVPNLLSGSGGGPSSLLSVNGRLQPVVTMRPGQVQLWRIVNGSSRSMVTFCPIAAGVSWRQIAQDGVQFKPVNYDRFGAVNRQFSLAGGNRADLLVQAPTTAGQYTLTVASGVAPGTCPANANTVLLNITVDATRPAANPQMPFVPAASLPEFPRFLEDIPASEARVKRELIFNSAPNTAPPHTAPPNNSHFINGGQFSDRTISQVMLLETAEEWTLYNTTFSGQNGVGNIQHPFHIHVNPFQVIEVFDPNAASAGQGGNCYADPAKPETWKPCTPEGRDFVWWDVFAIPAGRQDTLPSTVCTTADACPAPIRDRVQCSGGTCTVVIPGYFKMRTRFSDFPGQFVLHCHILAHEDRGMMQLVEVVPNQTVFGHH